LKAFQQPITKHKHGHYTQSRISKKNVIEVERLKGKYIQELPMIGKASLLVQRFSHDRSGKIEGKIHPRY